MGIEDEQDVLVEAANATLGTREALMHAIVHRSSEVEDAGERALEHAGIVDAAAGNVALLKCGSGAHRHDSAASADCTRPRLASPASQLGCTRV